MNDDNRPLLDVIVGFVSGTVSPTDFRAALYDKPEFADLLKDEAGSPPQWVRQSTYLHVIAMDFDDLVQTRSAKAALATWLDRHSIPYTADTASNELHAAMLAVQPSWLRMDGAYFNKLVSEAGDRRGGELRKWLKDEIRRRFVSAKRPPKWMQSPAWPIGPNGPLVFLGQLSTDKYFHDEGSVYVFLDPHSGTIETVIQVC